MKTTVALFAAWLVAFGIASAKDTPIDVPADGVWEKFAETLRKERRGTLFTLARSSKGVLSLRARPTKPAPDPIDPVVIKIGSEGILYDGEKLAEGELDRRLREYRRLANLAGLSPVVSFKAIPKTPLKTVNAVLLSLVKAGVVRVTIAV